MLRYDWPVGDPVSRLAARDRLPAHWQIALGYGVWYQLLPDVWNWHTGVDFVLHYPQPNSEINAPLYAVADGEVIYSGIGVGTWGWIIVVAHLDENGVPFYSRTAHGNHKTYTPVRTGDYVLCGDELIPLGNADGKFAYHVHFDISRSEAMRKNPSDWPGTNRARLDRDYVDPVAFIIARKLAEVQTMPILSAKVVKGDRLTGWPRPPQPGDIPFATYPANVVLQVNTDEPITGPDGNTYYRVPTEIFVRGDCLDLGNGTPPLPASKLQYVLATNGLLGRVDGSHTSPLTGRKYLFKSQVRIVPGTLKYATDTVDGVIVNYQYVQTIDAANHLGDWIAAVINGEPELSDTLPN